MSEPTIRSQVLDAIEDPSRDVQRAAIQIALERLTASNETSSPNKSSRKMGSSQRGVLIEEVERSEIPGQSSGCFRWSAFPGSGVFSG